jgi:hypothetical protein
MSFNDYTPEQQDAARAWHKAHRAASLTANAKASLPSVRRIREAEKAAERRCSELGMFGTVYSPEP